MALAWLVLTVGRRRGRFQGMSQHSRALRLLDAVQSLAQLDALDPTAFVAAVAEEAPAAAPRLADVGSALDAASAILAEIDRFIQKAMRIRLNHLSDPLPQQLRTLLYTTIAGYERDPALLRDRVAAALGRTNPSTAAALTREVFDAAERVLALRAALRRGV